MHPSLIPLIWLKICGNPINSSLQFKDQKKDQICINKTILLENLNSNNDDLEDDLIDVEVVESPGKPAYNHQKVKSMFYKILVMK